MSPRPAIAAAVGRSVRLPRHFTGRVTIEAVDPFDEVLFLRVRRDNGELAEATVTPAELEAALDDAGPGAAARLVPAQDLFLLVEDARIRLSYAYDPHFAVSLSGVEPYPHQLEAVYERMLPQTRLRFLLADDPGAGKTIMAGLLIKELRLRGVLDRVLILCPAPLAVQWQDELLGKFDERFEIVRSQDVRDAVAENPWAARDRVIASIDFAKRDEVRPRVLEAPWDLVIIDEAHKCSARRNGDEVDRTKRYQLAERLSELSERVLLLTATPHQGDRAAFALFTRLIDPDLFTGSEAIEPFREPDNPWFLRRQKEDLRDFEGRPLFVARHVHSQPFTLSIPEKGLYDAVTEFINTRTVMTLEDMAANAVTHGLSPEQREEVREKTRAAKADLARAVEGLYTRVALPVAGGDGPHGYGWRPLRTEGRQLSGSGVHERLMSLLRDHVFDAVTPSKLAQLVKLSDEEGGRRFYPCDRLVQDAFSFLAFPKIVDAGVIRRAIARGVEEGVFAYVPMARQEGDSLHADRPDLVAVRRPIPPDELDLGEGTFICTPALAKELAPPKEEEDAPRPPVEPGPLPGPSPSPSPPPPGEPRSIVVRFEANPSQLMRVIPGLTNLAERSADCRFEITVRATASSEDGYDRAFLTNAVEEHFLEADVPWRPEDGAR